MSQDELVKGARLIIGVQCAVYVVQEYGLSTTYCIGPSMIPTIANTPGSGTLAIVDSFSYKLSNKKYKRGDVVICASPHDVDKNVCKRIAAVGGDEVTIHRRNKHHIVHPRAGPTTTIIIPPGHVWLAGDNAENSTDSRKYGPVSLGLIKGRVFSKIQLSLFPFASVESMEWPHDAISVKHAKAVELVSDSDENPQSVDDAVVIVNSTSGASRETRRN